MKLHILISLLLLLTTVLTQQSTTISFLVEYEDQQEEDYIELGLLVSAEGSTLVNVMSEARKIADEIRQIATEFCQVHSKKKSDCKDIAEIGNYDIKPNYQIVKRQSKFIGTFTSNLGFTVSHEVAIKVLAVDHISDLADTILKEPDTKIVSFQWKPLKQVNKEQAAVKQGTAQGEELCDELGMQFGLTKSVLEMTEASSKDVAVYQFEIECLPGKNTKKDGKGQAKDVKKIDKKEQDKGVKNIKKEAKKEAKKEQKKEQKQVKKPVEEKKTQKPTTAEL